MIESIASFTDFQQNGFTLLKEAVPEHLLDQLVDEVEELRTVHASAGMRNLLNRSDLINNFASSGLAFATAGDLLGARPRPVRAILFDKTADTNWYVTWHQDLSIPVQNRIDIAGYGPWSTKEDILHVQPPAQILEKMVSLRLHLDDCAVDNGAIKFIAGSHLGGLLEPAQIAEWRDNHQHQICPAERGDIIAMRPLILHSSSTSTTPAHRRVLHLEYTSAELPAGLHWAQA
jgi:hypothetical protein